MKLIAATLMFVALSTFAQDKLKEPTKEAQESYVCIPEGVVRAAVDLIVWQQKRIADLERQLVERK